MLSTTSHTLEPNVLLNECMLSYIRRLLPQVRRSGVLIAALNVVPSNPPPSHPRTIPVPEPHFHMRRIAAQRILFVLAIVALVACVLANEDGDVYCGEQNCYEVRLSMHSTSLYTWPRPQPGNPALPDLTVCVPPPLSIYRHWD